MMEKTFTIIAKDDRNEFGTGSEACKLKIHYGNYVAWYSKWC